jgi:hypothetical protein
VGDLWPDFEWQSSVVVVVGMWASVLQRQLALLIHPKQPVRTGLGAILRERHGTAIASSDDDTAAAV